MTVFRLQFFTASYTANAMMPKWQVMHPFGAGCFVGLETIIPLPGVKTPGEGGSVFDKTKLEFYKHA